MKKNGIQKKAWAFVVLVVISLTFCGIGFAKSSEAQSKAEAKQILVPNVKNSQSEKALGPQPEPPDKPAPGSRSLGPQPEPPDQPLQGKDKLSPQPEPPDRN